MKYIILKRDITIVIIAESDAKRFEIVVEENKIITINVYKLLTFDIIESEWKNNGFKQIKKLTVRQNNEKDV